MRKWRACVSMLGALMLSCLFLSCSSEASVFDSNITVGYIKNISITPIASYSGFVFDKSQVDYTIYTTGKPASLNFTVNPDIADTPINYIVNHVPYLGNSAEPNPGSSAEMKNELVPGGMFSIPFTTQGDTVVTFTVDSLGGSDLGAVYTLRFKIYEHNLDLADLTPYHTDVNLHKVYTTFDYLYNSKNTNNYRLRFVPPKIGVRAITRNSSATVTFSENGSTFVAGSTATAATGGGSYLMYDFPGSGAKTVVVRITSAQDGKYRDITVNLERWMYVYDAGAYGPKYTYTTDRYTEDDGTTLLLGGISDLRASITAKNTGGTVAIGHYFNVTGTLGTPSSLVYGPEVTVKGVVTGLGVRVNNFRVTPENTENHQANTAFFLEDAEQGLLFVYHPDDAPAQGDLEMLGYAIGDIMQVDVRYGYHNYDMPIAIINPDTIRVIGNVNEKFSYTEVSNSSRTDKTVYGKLVKWTGMPVVFSDYIGSRYHGGVLSLSTSGNPVSGNNNYNIQYRAYTEFFPDSEWWASFGTGASISVYAPADYNYNNLILHVLSPKMVQ